MPLTLIAAVAVGVDPGRDVDLCRGSVDPVTVAVASIQDVTIDPSRRGLALIRDVTLIFAVVASIR